MRRRTKLDAGNFPSWEERIDYQMRYAFDRGDRLRETDRDLYVKVGELQGRADRAATAAEVQQLRRSIDRCFGILFGLACLLLVTWSIVGWLVMT